VLKLEITVFKKSMYVNNIVTDYSRVEWGRTQCDSGLCCQKSRKNIQLPSSGYKWFGRGYGHVTLAKW